MTAFYYEEPEPVLSLSDLFAQKIITDKKFYQATWINFGAFQTFIEHKKNFFLCRNKVPVLFYFGQEFSRQIFHEGIDVDFRVEIGTIAGIRILYDPFVSNSSFTDNLGNQLQLSVKNNG